MKVLLFRGIGGFTISRKTLEYLGITTQAGLEIEDDENMFHLYVQDFYPEKYNKIQKVKNREEFYQKLDELEIKMRGDNKLIKCWKQLGEDFSYINDEYDNFKLIEIPDNIEGLSIQEYDTGSEYIIDTKRKW